MCIPFHEQFISTPEYQELGHIPKAKTRWKAIPLVRNHGVDRTEDAAH
jgi:hypothetical protein